MSSIQKSSIEDMRKLLSSDFHISKGDNLLISSSFGNLNSAFSPKDLIMLFQEIIGDEGNLVLPFYPPGNSYEWAASGQVFDMSSTPSSMGILTQVFSEMPRVFKSKHPTKAVVAWGKNAQEIIANHESSTTPYYWDSPYGWMLKNPSKSVCLGLWNMPMFHACEDTILDNFVSLLYQEEKKKLKIIDYNNRLEVLDVLVHDPKKFFKLMEIGEYVSSLNLPSYKRINFGYTFCCLVDNQELFESCKFEFNHGNYRQKK